MSWDTFIPFELSRRQPCPSFTWERLRYAGDNTDLVQMPESQAHQRKLIKVLTAAKVRRRRTP
jgi:hypothetical protein